MVNELNHIGPIILKLSTSGACELANDDTFSLLRDEFSRIGLSIRQRWLKKGEDCFYGLDFHEAEAMRLMQKLSISRINFDLSQMHRKKKDEELLRLYKTLAELLDEVIKQIALMRSGLEMYAFFPDFE